MGSWPNRTTPTATVSYRCKQTTAVIRCFGSAAQPVASNRPGRLVGRPSTAACQAGAPGSYGSPDQAQLVVEQQPEQQTELQLKQRLSLCPICSGTGRVTCKDCSGEGFLPRGGYSKKNPLIMNRAVGSKWTALVNTLGWRHFRVTAVRKLDKHNTFLLLQASCDSSAQLWVPAATLRNRSCWAAGWLQMKELLAQEEDGAAASSGHRCHSCTGLGYRACSACDGRGRTDLVVL